MLQEASKARESRLRKAGIQGRARLASELRDMDNAIAALSKALAVRLLRCGDVLPMQVACLLSRPMWWQRNVRKRFISIWHRRLWCCTGNHTASVCSASGAHIAA